MTEEKIDPRHSGVRNIFRVLGPVVLAIGLILVIVGFVSFFSAFGGFDPPKYFWCVFLGMPVLFVGLALCKLGYMGRVARYVSGEISPVVKDTFNYIADGTQDGVKSVASAIGAGLREGSAAESTQTKIRCHKCNALLGEDAKFCSNCGTNIGKSKSCPGCGELNDPDARFCDECGYNFNR